MRLDLRAARWTWFQSFGHLPPQASNPYHMYIERRDSRLPRPASMEEAVGARRDGLAELLEADPAVLAALPHHVAAYLQSLVGPAARVPHARVWEAAAHWDGRPALPGTLRRCGRSA
jgi:hypothetical protein